MKKTTLTIILILIFMNLSFATDNKTNVIELGNPITLNNTTPISHILNTPLEFLGDTVLVNGTIIEICKKRGCWMEIASDEEFQSIRIKVKDGEIIFPLSAKGSDTLVQGVVEQLVFTLEEIVQMEQHYADEQGTEFDPSTITEGKTIYRIRGLGAQINQ